MTEGVNSAQRDLYITLGIRIRDARTKVPLTQAQLAASLGLSRTSITNIEKGRQQILVHTLYRIAAVLRTDVSALLPELERKRTADYSAGTIPKGVTRKDWKLIKPLVEGTHGRQAKAINSS